jgi:hypothetical protein
MTKPVIEVKDLAKSFGENDVLKDITEKVETRSGDRGDWSFWWGEKYLLTVLEPTGDTDKWSSRFRRSRSHDGWIPRALTRFVKKWEWFSKGLTYFPI